jgi:methyl-accepting chemotaxis protein
MQEMAETRSTERMAWRIAQGFAATGIVLGAVAVIVVIGVLIGPYNTFVDRLHTASDEIAVIEDTLSHTGNALDQLVDTLQTTGDSFEQIGTGMDDLDALLQSVSGFLSEEAPDTIESARSAILSTQEGARAMDQVLRGLATVSFITGVEYDPEQPLDASLAEVADSLSPLPESLRQVSGDLEDVQANLDQLQETLSAMQADLSGLREELQDSSGSMRQNADSAGQMANQVELLAARLQRFRFLIGLGLLFMALNFCTSQWVIWQMAKQHAVLIGSMEQTQPTRTGVEG